MFAVSDGLALSDGIRLPAVALRTSPSDHASATSLGPAAQYYKHKKPV
jgi:hypothetical protein